MTRLISLAALAAVLITAGRADARTPARSVKSTVTIRDATPGARLTVRLAPGTRLKSLSGATTSGRRGAIVVKPKRATLTLVTRGAKQPTRWRIGTTPCATKNAKRRGSTARVTVTCAGAKPKQAPGTPTGGSPTTTPAPTTGGASFRFAPYVDFAGWPMPDLATLRQSSGVDHISLGFVVQSTNGGCDATWGGFPAYPASGSDARGRDAVQAFKQSGGDVVPSFGGAAGTELALVCGSVDELAAAYQGVIDTYAATHVDFDIEGATIGDTAANTKRAQAIAKLQQANPALVVTYTIPTETTGPDAAGQAAIGNAVANGVNLAAVNIMTMDYSSTGGAAGRMGAAAIQAGTALHGRLVALYPGLSDAQVWGKVGVTPMLGINDVADQIFTVDDARLLAAWASTNHIGMIGMWALERDNQCATPVTTKQLKCSAVPQNEWDFSRVFSA